MNNKRLLLISSVAAIPPSFCFLWLAPNDFFNPAWVQLLFGYGIGFGLTTTIMALLREHLQIERT